MDVKLRKLLAAASCWLVILYGSLDHHVEGADHAATVDGILRSVVAVRSQLEPVVKFRLAQRTTALPQVTRTGGLSCGETVRASGLQRLFNCVTSDNRPSEAAPTVAQVNVQERTDDTPQHTTVEIISAERKAAWTTYSDGTSSVVQDEKKRPYQGEPVHANPLGLIFPTLQQISQFNQWQRPYQSPNQFPTATIPTSIITTTTVRPHANDFYLPPTVPTSTITSANTTIRPRVNDFYFPDSGDDHSAGVSTVSIPTSGHTGQHHWDSSTPSNFSGSDITEQPVEEETTEPPEDESGLGNRIDSKVLLSLVG